MQFFSLYTVLYHVSNIIVLEDYAEYRECANLRTGCIKVIHETFDLFGTSCDLPNWCGPVVTKHSVGNWLDKYYLCQRRSLSTKIKVRRLRFKIPFRELFPIIRKVEIYPAKFTDLIIIDDGDSSYIQVDHSKLCLNEVVWSDLCVNGELNGTISNAVRSRSDAISYSDIPSNLFRRFYIHGNSSNITNLVSALYHLPYGLVLPERELTNDAAIAIPCQSTYGVLKIQQMRGRTFVMYESNLQIVYTFYCVKWCVITKYRDNRPMQRGFRWFNTANLTVSVKHRRMFVCDVRKCKFIGPLKEDVLLVTNGTNYTISNSNLLCGRIEPDHIRLTESVVYNHSHYIKDFKLLPFYKSYVCNKHVEMTTDVMHIIAGFTQIVNFVMHFVIGILMTLLDFLVSLTFSVEDVVEQVLRAVVKIMLTLADVIIDTMIRSQFFVEIATMAGGYFLIYNIHRDNWLSFMIIFGILIIVKVIKTATRRYDV